MMWTHLHNTLLPCWIQIIAGEGGNGLHFLSNGWLSFLFFAINVSIELLTFVKLAVKKCNNKIRPLIQKKIILQQI